VENQVSYIPSDGIVVSENSSTTPLNAGATFTGEWVDVSAFSTVTVAISTDQHCTYVAQFSPDGTNIDSPLTRYYVVGKINAPDPFVVLRKYFRLVITNTSASNQTYLRAQSMAGSQVPTLNIPTDAVMSQRYASISVRPSSYPAEAVLGLRQGITAWQKFGYNSDLDIADGERTIWDYKAAGLTPLTTARTLSLVSSSANDAAAGTGLRTCVIYGIDANRAAASEVVTLNGTTPVVTSGTWLGVNRIAPASAGTGLTNAGNITVTATTDATVQAYIPAGKGTTQQAFFFVPANTKFLTDWLTISAARLSGGTAPRITVIAYVRDFTAGVRYEIGRWLIDTVVVNDVELKPPQPFLIPGSCLLEFVASTDTNNATVSLRFAGDVHDNIGT
jgi:hypothetical protein